MGGIGSGRYVRINAKETTGDYRALDVNLCNRKGFLSPGAGIHLEWTNGGYRIASLDGKMVSGRMMDVTFREHFGNEREGIRQSISLDWVPCNYGSKRPYFICPVSRCKRRLSVLHCGQTIACRHCRQLAYPSQREVPEHRAIRQAEKIRQRLGWELGIFFGHGDRPKGMHWRVFERLVDEYDDWVSQSMAGMAERLGLPDEGD